MRKIIEQGSSQSHRARIFLIQSAVAAFAGDFIQAVRQCCPDIGLIDPVVEIAPEQESLDGVPVHPVGEGSRSEKEACGIGCCVPSAVGPDTELQIFPAHMRALSPPLL